MATPEEREEAGRIFEECERLRREKGLTQAQVSALVGHQAGSYSVNKNVLHRRTLTDEELAELDRRLLVVRDRSLMVTRTTSLLSLVAEVRTSRRRLAAVEALKSEWNVEAETCLAKALSLPPATRERALAVRQNRAYQDCSASLAAALETT